MIEMWLLNGCSCYLSKQMIVNPWGRELQMSTTEGSSGADKCPSEARFPQALYLFSIQDL